MISSGPQAVRRPWTRTLSLWILRIREDLIDEEPGIWVFFELFFCQSTKLQHGRKSVAYLVQRRLRLFLLRGVSLASVLALVQHRAVQRTYCLAAALVEGAHCGVELLNGQRHGGRLCWWGSSLYGSRVCRGPQEALQQTGAVWRVVAAGGGEA